jgi:hypothetical protein
MDNYASFRPDLSAWGINANDWLGSDVKSAFAANNSNATGGDASSSTVIGSEVVHPALATRLALLREI